jgi:hypothetical protein
MFSKILIANRGEIACRVIKTARKMGIATVAVYSEADRDARHVELADEAVLHRAGAQPRELPRGRQDHRRLQEHGRQAVHPGYGFLSENEDFAAASRKRASSSSAPSTTASPRWATRSPPRSWPTRPRSTPSRLERRHRVARAGGEIAKDIGYPVMIKASAGGGGKGLRVAFNDKEAFEGFASCRNEAKATASATTASSSRSSSRSRATSRSRCWATRTATSSTSTSASAQHPAPAPEGDRGGAVALHQRRHAQGHGRAGGGAGQGGEVPERRHGGVRGRQGPGASTSWR